MSKSKSQSKSGAKAGRSTSSAQTAKSANKDSSFIVRMSYAYPLGESLPAANLIPAIIFGALVIMIARCHTLERNMAQFYWHTGESTQSDFFSYYKMVAILICAVLAVLFILYRLCTQTLAIKRTAVYVPMAVYTVMVIVSYIFCDYKDFSLLGYNDRFEGTLTLIAYMVMLFFVINAVNSEKNAKLIIWAIGISSAILAFLGLSQALGCDFFQTTIGQKLLLPNNAVTVTEDIVESGICKELCEAGLISIGDTTTVYELIDLAHEIGKNYLSFRFDDNQIYQTVYNINYVSFYLTLLVPLFGMLFIRCVMKKDEPLYKKLLTGALFGLLLYNMIGSRSSGGWAGLAFGVIVAIIVFNKKIIKWRVPLAILIAITVVVCGATFSIWSDEVLNVIVDTEGDEQADKLVAETSEGASDDESSDFETEITGPDTAALIKAPEAGELAGAGASKENTVSSRTHNLKYIDTDGDDIVIGIDDNKLIITTYPDTEGAITITDQDGKDIYILKTDKSNVFALDDARFSECFVSAEQSSKGVTYIVFSSDNRQANWAFVATDDGVKYANSKGNLVDLDIVPHIGFENNTGFGSGRGYIWSRTFPMMKDTALIGHGADTYCIYFPQNDYIGKYNSSSYYTNINIIVDKPHNMYLGAWIGTGGISVIALLALYGMYLVSSLMRYAKRRFDEYDFATFAGAGIFIGITSFLFSGLVDDSTVSVMPLFYTLLGTGIALNFLLKRRVCGEKESDAEHAEAK